MLTSAIRELAASGNSSWIAAALFENIVQVWDVASPVKINELSTVFSFGANNLAVSPDADVLVAGESKARGIVAAYETRTGRMIWKLELVFPSCLSFDSSGGSILCTQNGQSLVRLDARTGIVLEEVKGISRSIQSPDGCELRVSTSDRTGKLRLLANGKSFDIPKMSFAILDTAFSPHSVCLTEVAERVRCINCSNGKIQWSFEPEPGFHVLKLHYSRALDAFHGVLWDFEKGGRRKLLRFDTAKGTPSQVCEFDSWEEVFVEASDQLLTSSGALLDLANGEVVSRLNFPRQEYPPHD